MKNFKNYILIAVTTALLGELYFYPFGGEFRFSIGVIAFGLALILFPEINEIKLSVYTGTSIFALRCFIEYLLYGSNLPEIIINTYPSFIYYFLYGVILYLLNIKRSMESSYLTVSLLFTADVLCNIIEALIRDNLNFLLFKYIVSIGIMRSIIAYGAFVLIENQKSLIRKKEHQKRYMQLNTLVSNIQAELFYLKKSALDIENVMNKSYSLYEMTKELKDISMYTLDIAREVHEVKKDYYRVLDGFESFLKDFEKNDAMNFKDIAFIIEGNSRRYIEEYNKDIKLSFTVNDDIYIKKYYSIFTILNNLIVNSIDSIKLQGSINIIQSADNEYVTLIVTDNGKGIDKDNLPYIFKPGFTTKYDIKTGKASTGIGLSHVKNIIDEMKGEIKVTSDSEKTEFIVKLPLKLDI